MITKYDLKQRIYVLFNDWDSYGCATAEQELKRLFNENNQLRKGTQLRREFSWLEKELGITSQN